MSVALDQGVRLSFPGDRVYLSAVREFVRELLESARDGDPFTERDLCEIQLAIQEACVNAIRHGNGDDAAKPVGLRIAIAPDRVAFRVSDEGPGFDLAQISLPGENEPREGGYGLAILRRTMEDVRVERNGDGASISFWRRRGADR